MTDLARGAWIRAVTPAIVAAGGEIDRDPFRLFTGAGGEDGRLEYDPAILESIQTGGHLKT